MTPRKGPKPRTAFVVERELARIAAGWAELHPIARLGYPPPTVVMVSGPRDADELEVVYGLVVESNRNAGGRALPWSRPQARSRRAARRATAAPATTPTR